MQGVPEHGNPPPVIWLYVDLNLQTLVSADIVPQTNGNAENARPSARLLAEVRTSATSLPTPRLPQPGHFLLTDGLWMYEPLTSCVSSVQEQEAEASSGQTMHSSPEPLQQRVLVEAASATSRAPAEAQAMSVPPLAASQPAPDGHSTEASAGLYPQPVQGGLSGPANTEQEAARPLADTRQEEAQGPGFKAYSKACKAPLIAVDANTQEAASDAAPQPDAHKQCTTPGTTSTVSSWAC